MKMDLARQVAIKILYKIEEEAAYSNLILDEYLQKERQKLSLKDINFISELVYGTVTWKLTIDSIIQKYSSIKINKISKWVLEILRIGVYQIVFLDKVPRSAAVNECVNLCKKYGFKSTRFVNAVLRKVEKQDYEELKKIEDQEERISKVYSMPQWFVKELIHDYGIQTAEEICKNSNVRPCVTVRRNVLKISQEEFEKKLEELKINFEHGKLENFYYLKNLKNIAECTLFQKGYFTVQDEGAGEIAMVLNPQPNQFVLDACSAPGGKTTHLAELMKDQGKIIAWDIHSHRVKLVEENKIRLGITCICEEVQDATIIKDEYREKFDKILLDVPCLGFGVLKRKPDIKWQRKKEDEAEITKIQLQLLYNASKYLKKGGELVYSTCSILKVENENIVEKFLMLENVEKNRNKTEFEIVEQKNILPNKFSDGFFICKIKKK